MADPMTWAIIGLGTSLVGAATSTTLGIVGSAREHNQAKANAKMQAEQAQYNKRLEDREASRIEAESAENAKRQRDAANQLKAQQRALLGKSGAAISSGSPLAILGEAAADEELKINDSLRSGYVEADQHRERAKMFEYQSRVAKAQAPSSTSLGLTIAGHGADFLGKAGDSIFKFASFSKGQ